MSDVEVTLEEGLTKIEKGATYVFVPSRPMGREEVMMVQRQWESLDLGAKLIIFAL